MRAKLVALKRTLNFVPARTMYSKGDRCDAHMNELPVPCGPWSTYYKERNAFYNKHLIFGALWFAFTVGMVIYTDCIFFNWSPPAVPGPPSDMVEECEDEP